MKTERLIPLEEAVVNQAPTRRRAKPQPQLVPDDIRPLIRLEVGPIEQVVDEIERALVNSGRGVYQQANRIVGVGGTPMITADRQNVLAKEVYQLGPYRILELLASSARFEKYDGRSGDFVPTDVTLDIIHTLIQRCGHLKLLPLTALIEAPTLRSDGSVLSTPGYDSATGLLFHPGEEYFPPIPHHPTIKQAQDALQSIEGLLVGFPFVSDADRSVATAAILTACVRRSLRTAPAFIFTAPVRGSGKSKLVDLTSVIAYGREAGVIALGKDDAETEKRIAALLLGGLPIAIDNADSNVGGDLLCQLLTQTSVRSRILGKSKTPVMSTNVLVTVTGNNVIIVGDLTRRSLFCRLDPCLEMPELRKFEWDPIERVKEDRGAYLVAALVVLRAFFVAGQPQRAPRLGSFEEWSDIVRSALIWLGRADPVSTMEHGRSTDPRLEQMRAVLLQWRVVIGFETMSASDAAQLASSRERPVHEGKGEFCYKPFREALMSVAGDGGCISSLRLGKWLSKISGRVVDGSRIEKASSHAGTCKWQLVQCGGDGGEWGESPARTADVS